MHPEELDPRALCVLVLVLALYYGAKTFALWRADRCRERAIDPRFTRFVRL